ncbi:MAG TPA: glycosyltransferase [Deltaproteobacteria bacterium]|nr:glycosyltransferase [Deltaproteobacteria bacterium]
MKSKQYDVVVGIPSYNEAATIAYVTSVAGQGLAQYFPDTRNIIVNVDNCSPDDTRGAFFAADIPVGIDKHYISTPEGVKGKGNNFWNLFHFCKEAGAAIVIVVDADLRSITPEWISYLGYPIRDGQDFVTPLYSRHQFDGTITNHLCYPFVYSLAGLDVRQPIGGDFAFSRKLCSYWLEQKWDDMTRQYGIDIFMSLNALFGNFKICQAGMGSKVHNASAPKLGQMFEEVVYTLFSTLHRNRNKWLEEYIDKSSDVIWKHQVQAVEQYGLEKMTEPQTLSIDIVKLKSDCRDEYQRYQSLVKRYLNPYAFARIDHMQSMDYYDVDILLWSHIVYSLFYLFDEATEDEKKDIINALKPLYFARSITFDYETFRYSINFAEAEVRNQAMAFLCQKPYLLGLYHGNHQRI